MNTDIVIFTVPHSGTQFTLQFIKNLGFQHWNENRDRLRKFGIAKIPRLYHNQHSGPWLGQQMPNYMRGLQEHKVIVTARHPYKTLNSFLQRGRLPARHLQCWLSFLQWLPKTDHHILDLDCKEELRTEQMLSVLKHINADSPENIEIAEQYVSEWKPLNVTEGRLLKHENINITENDLEKLDFAIEWYESLPTNAFGDK